MIENWKLIPGFDGRYEITEIGRIRSVCDIIRNTGRKPTGHEIACKIGIGGYFYVALRLNGKQRSYSIHRLLCQTFLPNPENKPCVNHKNSNRADNRIENLEWCTYSENNSHAYKFGFQKRTSGESHNQSILNWEKVNEIRSKYKKGIYTMLKLANEFSVSKSCIAAIIYNISWKQSEQAA